MHVAATREPGMVESNLRYPEDKKKGKGDGDQVTKVLDSIRYIT